MSGQAVERIQQVLIDTGAVAAIEAEISDLTVEAMAALDAMEIRDEARNALADLANFVAYRNP